MIQKDARIDALLSGRREEARERGERRRKAIYSRYPSLEKLDREIRICRADLLLEIVGTPGDRPDYDELASLEGQRVLLLQKESIPSDYDRPVPFCSLCEDAGVVDGVLCTCYRGLLIPSQIRDGGLSDYREMTFSHYSEDYYSDPMKMRMIRKLCEEYADGFPGQSRNHLFLGKPGTGKTYLSLCIANRVADSGVPVLFVRMNELLDLMNGYRIQMTSYSPDIERLSQLEKKRGLVFDADFLVIDELGVEAKGPNTTADLLEILGSRRVKNTATLITSNLTASDLQKNYDNRLYSRLFGDFSVVPFTGDDIRQHPNYRRRFG